MACTLEIGNPRKVDSLIDLHILLKNFFYAINNTIGATNAKMKENHFLHQGAAYLDEHISTNCINYIMCNGGTILQLPDYFHIETISFKKKL